MKRLRSQIGLSDMADLKREVLVLLGQTGIGKTAVSIPLAKMLGAEIISADSRQVYTGLDIGTAKPSIAEREGIPHHLIDVADPGDDFTVADFQRLAFEKLEDILGRGRMVLVVGGTGLYITALAENPTWQAQPPVPDLRKVILEEIADRGAQALYEELKRFDPDAAEKIHPNNIPRLVRAVEVVRSTGRKFSDGVATDKKDRGESRYDWKLVGLTISRETLYERINRRVVAMTEAGWVDEVRGLLEEGLTGNEKPMTGLGYRDIVAVVRGEINMDEAVERIQRDTRRFAKRQMTYFRKLENVNWVEAGEGFDPTETAKRVLVSAGIK